MIYFSVDDLYRITLKFYTFGTMVHRSQGWNCMEIKEHKETAEAVLRSGEGWELREVNPGLYNYVKRYHPEELI